MSAGDMSDAIVDLRGVRRVFEDGRVVALDSVDLVVSAGEFVVITGPSGSGKSTLLNMIGAMDLPDEGEVIVGGVPVVDRKSMERVRSEKIGYVFQMHNLIPVLSASDNVEIPLIPLKVPRRVRRKRADELLGLVGLGDRCRTNVRLLSGGERQRVAIARALAHNPPLLLADEPTGNLDSHTGEEVMALMHRLRAESGAALVLVTHNEDLCEGADRHLHLQDGQWAG
jgi:ABC-type lipoprotein export system ATPase subunit